MRIQVRIVRVTLLHDVRVLSVLHAVLYLWGDATLRFITSYYEENQAMVISLLARLLPRINQRLLLKCKTAALMYFYVIYMQAYTTNLRAFFQSMKRQITHLSINKLEARKSE